MTETRDETERALDAAFARARAAGPRTLDAELTARLMSDALAAMPAAAPPAAPSRWRRLLSRALGTEGWSAALAGAAAAGFMLGAAEPGPLGAMLDPAESQIAEAEPGFADPLAFLAPEVSP